MITSSLGDDDLIWVASWPFDFEFSQRILEKDNTRNQAHDSKQQKFLLLGLQIF